MIKYLVTEKPWTYPVADAVLFFVSDDFPEKKPKYVTEAFGQHPHVEAVLKSREFTGKGGQICNVPVMQHEQVVTYIFAGIGSPATKKSLEQYRRALGRTVSQMKHSKATTVALPFPSVRGPGVTKQVLAQETATILSMADYVFDQYITESSRKSDAVRTITISTDSVSKNEVSKGVKTGKQIGYSVNNARYWIDLPPSDLTPSDLTDQAAMVADNHNLTLTVYGEKEIDQMGMGGLAYVSRGARSDCKCALLEYRAKRKNAPTIALVGKGITFDSGGLSLKPAQCMETMKEDMSGAAAVLGTMEAVGQLKPNVHVIGVMPLAENLPGEAALKPGDIVTFYNGKTAEVRNTDAEGRLILADALAYASQEIKPDAMIDLATLTGACQHALGPFFSGLMSQHDVLANKIEQAGQRTGDRVWPLPFDDDYKAAIVSDVADIRNTGKAGYYAGSVTAGFFLQNFVGDTPWAHLDIAGTAFNVPDRPYFSSGATGAGVRLLIDFIMHWS